MKTYGHLFPHICSPENLDAACDAAARGKRLRPETAAFLFQREIRLHHLRQRLLRHTYCPLPGRVVLVRDPKPRAVTVTPFENRLVQHALCDVLEPLLVRSYIYDTWACLEGRGTHRAVLRLLGFMRKNRFLLQLDVHKYFPSLPRERLLQRLGTVITDPDVLWLTATILGGDACSYLSPEMLRKLGYGTFRPRPGCGLPIGHLSSQVFGNYYLSDLDHYVKRELKVRCYLRYLDDLVLFADNRAQLRRWTVAIRAYLKGELGLALNAARVRIHPCTAKVTWLGYRVGRKGLEPGKRMLSRIQRCIRAVGRRSASPHELRRLRDTLTAYRGLLTPL